MSIQEVYTQIGLVSQTLYVLFIDGGLKIMIAAAKKCDFTPEEVKGLELCDIFLRFPDRFSYEIHLNLLSELARFSSQSTNDLFPLDLLQLGQISKRSEFVPIDDLIAHFAIPLRQVSTEEVYNAEIKNFSLTGTEWLFYSHKRIKEDRRFAPMSNVSLISAQSSIPKGWEFLSWASTSKDELVIQTNPGSTIQVAIRHATGFAPTTRKPNVKFICRKKQAKTKEPEFAVFDIDGKRSAEIFAIPYPRSHSIYKYRVYKKN